MNDTSSMVIKFSRLWTVLGGVFICLAGTSIIRLISIIMTGISDPRYFSINPFPSTLSRSIFIITIQFLFAYLCVRNKQHLQVDPYYSMMNGLYISAFFLVIYISEVSYQIWLWLEQHIVLNILVVVEHILLVLILALIIVIFLLSFIYKIKDITKEKNNN